MCVVSVVCVAWGVRVCLASVVYSTSLLLACWFSLLLNNGSQGGGESKL